MKKLFIILIILIFGIQAETENYYIPCQDSCQEFCSDILNKPEAVCKHAKSEKCVTFQNRSIKKCSVKK